MSNLFKWSEWRDRDKFELGWYWLIVDEWAITISLWEWLEDGKPFSGKLSLVISLIAVAISFSASIFNSNVLAVVGVCTGLISYGIDIIDLYNLEDGRFIDKFPTIAAFSASTVATLVSLYGYMHFS